MGNYSFQLERIITLPEGAFLQYKNKNNSNEHLYFYDANNNQQLDLADEMVIETVKEKQHDFQADRVSSKVIQDFGPEAAQALSQVRKERERLRRSFTSVKVGECFAPSDNGRYINSRVEFGFDPPLSLKTKRAGPFYDVIVLGQLKESKKPQEDETEQGKISLDPAQCFMTSSVVPWKQMEGVSLNPAQIEIGTGGLLSPSVLEGMNLLNSKKYLKHPLKCELKNGDALDVTYRMLHGAMRVHLDLTPPSP